MTFAIVRLSSPPDTHAPTVKPFRSANVIAIAKVSCKLGMPFKCTDRPKRKQPKVRN
jgi:hypothetical protein